MQSDENYLVSAHSDELREKIAKNAETVESDQLVDDIQNTIDEDKTGDCYKLFYHKDKLDTKGQNPAGNSCLTFAIASRLPEVASLLINDAKNKLTSDEFAEFINYRYKDPTGQDREYYTNTALTLAVKHGNYKLAEKLLEEGADHNIGDRYNIIPLSGCYFQLGLAPEGKADQLIQLLKKLRDKNGGQYKVDLLGLKPSDYLLGELDPDELVAYIVPKEYKGFFHAEMESKKQITSTLHANGYDDHFIKSCLSKWVAVYQSDCSTSAKIYNSFCWGDKDVDQNMLLPHRKKEFFDKHPKYLEDIGSIYSTPRVFEEIKKLNEALTSPNAMICCDNGYISFNDLKDLEADKIKALTSHEAQQCYKKKYTSFSDLKDFEPDKIEALTSSEAQRCYERYTTFDEFKKLDIRKIEALTSLGVLRCCYDGYVRFNDLKDFEPDKIEALTSMLAIMCYAAGQISFNDLKNLEANKIKILIIPNVAECYNNGKVSFNDLKEFEADKIQALTSYDAQQCYEEGYISFSDLKNLELDKIKALTSYDASRCYEKLNTKSQTVTFAELKGFVVQMK